MIQVDIECEVTYSLDLSKMMYAGDTNVGVVSTLMVVEVIRVDNSSQENVRRFEKQGARKSPKYSKIEGSGRGERSRKSDWEVIM